MLARPVEETIGYPAGLNRAILHAVGQKSPPPKNRHGRAGKLSPWLAPAALAAIALGAALILLLREPEPVRPVMAGTDSDSRESFVVSEIPASDNWMRTWSAAIDRPLDHELECVVADARTAVRFLAVNFLPESDRAEENL